MKNLLRKLLKIVFDRLGIPRSWTRQSAFELRMIAVRLYALFPFQNRKIKKIMRLQEVNIIFGCGDTRHDNWIGTDCFWGRNVDLVLDLRRPLPFPSGSLDTGYSEHFLEHLTPEEGQQHLRDVQRVLKPGGIYRIAVPAAMRFVKNYLDGNEEFFKKAFPWARRPMEAVYCIMNWEGEHKNILDYDELEYMSRIAGFSTFERSEANASKKSILRIDRSDAQRVAETFYVELTK